MQVCTTRAGLPSRLFTPKTTLQPRTPESYGVFVLRKAVEGTWIWRVVHFQPRKCGNTAQQQLSRTPSGSKARPAAFGGAFWDRCAANLTGDIGDGHTWE